MNGHDGDKRLDEAIRRTIDTQEPVFDHEAWAEKHPEAVAAIKSLSAKTKATQAGRPRVIEGGWALKLAVAAVIVIVAGLVSLQLKPRQEAVTPIAGESLAQVCSMMSLNRAWRQGDMDAVDEQFEKTIKTFRPRSASLSMQELLNGANGS